ncbi:MAG: T9SS type A sorting domain-containing protein [Lewinella sp.]
MYTNYTYRVTIVALLFSLLSTASLFAQSCAHPDYSSLEKFYAATEGDSWSNNDGWLTDCEPCSWTGIGCDENDRVTSIILRGNGLTGTLPTEIGDFEHLLRINLAYNEVGGELPASLFTIASLRDINFSGNLLSGTLPSTVGEQPLLENLRLNNNQLEGSLPDALASFTQMKILTLNDNGFTGALPEGFGDLPFLFNLDFSANDLAGCFPQDLENLCGNARMRFGGNVKLSWSGDFPSYCASNFAADQVGAPCDDGNQLTSNDVINNDCGCGGQFDPSGILGMGDRNTDVEPELNVAPEGPTYNNPGSFPDPTNQLFDWLRVFPNPVVAELVSVQLPAGTEQAQLRLLSLNGRVISETTMNSPSGEMPLPGLSPGVYLLEAITAGERSVQRIIVQ